MSYAAVLLTHWKFDQMEPRLLLHTAAPVYFESIDLINAQTVERAVYTGAVISSVLPYMKARPCHHLCGHLCRKYLCC